MRISGIIRIRIAARESCSYPNRDLHNRPQATTRIGTEITDPNIDFAKVAQGMGVWAEGPVTDPAKLGPALKRALDVVKKGQPALIDVVCQPR